MQLDWEYAQQIQMEEQSNPYAQVEFKLGETDEGTLQFEVKRTNKTFLSSMKDQDQEMTDENARKDQENSSKSGKSKFVAAN